MALFCTVLSAFHLLTANLFESSTTSLPFQVFQPACSKPLTLILEQVSAIHVFTAASMPGRMEFPQ
jgi:hypothetical protein